MAEESIIQKKFNISFGELALFANTIVMAMNRDIAEMADYGVTATTISDFQDAIDDFQELPDDEILRTDLSYAIEQRDIKKEAVLKTIRSINARAKAVFGENSAKYRSMAPGTISKMSESDLLTAARQVHMAAVANLAALAAEGVTIEYLNTFNTAIQDYENAIDEVANRKNLRDEATENKINQGNDLYALVVKYCDYGKLIWDGVSPAKYNDYIIYTATSSGSLTAPQNFMFDPVNYDFSWSAVENATSYILQELTDGTNWTEYWSGAETTCAYEESPTTIMYFRVLAHNAGGNSAPSNTLTYDFAPNLIAPGSFHYNPETYYFSWTEVPNAEYYEFQYRAQTNPTWNSLNAGNATSFLHADPPGDYLARVRAVAGTTMGPWSIELEYTVGPIQPN